MKQGALIIASFLEKQNYTENMKQLKIKKKIKETYGQMKTDLFRLQTLRNLEI